MKTLKNNFIKVFFGLLIVTSIVSCDKGGDPNPGGTTTGKFAGEWYISLTDTDGASLVEHALHSTYNASANDNTMWIDDYENGYYIKCKITVDTANGTFTATDSENLLDGSLVTITDGKIEKGAATSKGGHVVDKISFRAHFDYDVDGYDILYEGHKRTGFLEDEY
jgi:hypothetical protein